MRASTKLIRLCAVVPSGLAGGFVAVMGLGFLPGAGLVAAFAATLVVAVVLAFGVWEAPAVRVFAFARGLRASERAALSPVMAILDLLELKPERVVMRLTDTGGLPATWIGRRTVVIEPLLVHDLYESQLTAEDAAAAIGHAVASQRLGPARFDLSARLWALPWTLLHAVVRQISRFFTWVPAAGFAWHLRGVIGVVVVVQGFAPGGNRAIGLAAGLLVAVSYIAPAADRKWRRVVQRGADQVVALAGLAGSLVSYARWQDGAASMARVHLIIEAAEQRTQQRRAMAADSEPATNARQGDAVVLMHPAALR